SRRRHTRFSRDWSSDVCSSDLKAVVLLVALLLLAFPVLAAAEASMPWDHLEVAIGPVVLVWGAFVAGIIQALKAVQVGSPPRPLLDTGQDIWLANVALGGVGVLVYALTQGRSEKRRVG